MSSHECTNFDHFSNKILEILKGKKLFLLEYEMHRKKRELQFFVIIFIILINHILNSQIIFKKI